MARETERRGQGRSNDRRDRRDREEPEFQDRLVAINRVSKTVKGGKRFGFAALVVVGDQKGRVGYGSGKAREVPEAIRKATEEAKRGIVRVPLREGRTLHHDIEGRHGAGRVVMRTATAGTGIIAGGPMRAVFEMLGVQDVVSKSIGTQNPYNMIRATFDGLGLQTSPRQVAARRGKKVADIMPKRDEAPMDVEPETASAFRPARVRWRRGAARRSPTSCPSVTKRRWMSSPKRLRPSEESGHGKDHRRQADRQPDPPPRQAARHAGRSGPEQDAPRARA